ncbi:serine/threonine-protein kinase RsbW [Anaerosolibacter carboniphilus]|uniref:Serine/threonine-protein kinase RsbW n=1 Tax=Anaerosolibacter carboniphilus TaxID=1417629 RepID=A0A841KVS9_9FIRM|nr:ATP-binding protein [Anaerosolibacter carboniphilus]MBB6217754.1 serine/threonine-protein kinase RsbW [Anaerosolibacter carboniphilus]
MKREIIVYGLDKIGEVIDTAISDLNWKGNSFDIRIILMEAFTNAFIHGNQKDTLKPIFFRYDFSDSKVQFEIQDCGDVQNEVSIPIALSEESILNESGRGLFIIQSFSDHVQFRNNTLIIEKSIVCQP